MIARFIEGGVSTGVDGCELDSVLDDADAFS